MVRIRRLTAGFGERTVLQDVDLDLKGPGIQVLVGSQGSGKSTLLASIARTHQSGDAWVRGEVDASGTIAFLEQAPAPLPDSLRTVLHRTSPGVSATALVREHLGQHPAAHALIEGLDVPQDRLSAGLGRVAHVVAAVAAEPDALLLDEPDAGLTALELEPLLACLLLQSRLRTLVVTTRSPEFARRLDVAPAQLVDGRLVQGPPLNTSPRPVAPAA